MYLLDTHTLIWFLEGNTNIPEPTRLLLRRPQNQLRISIASFWEMAIKLNTGKLVLPDTLNEIIIKTERLGIETIPINTSHVLQVEMLPLHHRDPFDRLIIAQAIVENLTLISKDDHFNQYAVPVIWD